VRAAVLAALGAGLLAGCVQPASLYEETIACELGNDGEPANGVVLMAQSVPSASYVPCLETMPLGWHLSDMEAHENSARFWLDSDRYGDDALEVQLTASCDTSEATEIPSDLPDMRRFERVLQVSPRYVGRRSYVFEGGCVTVVFALSGRIRTEPLGVATEAFGAISREALREHVREETGGRLELDPAAGSGS
jgi:hypothetical protein